MKTKMTNSELISIHSTIKYSREQLSSIDGDGTDPFLLELEKAEDILFKLEKFIESKLTTAEK